MLFMDIISIILQLYFYLSHDDLKRGALTPYEITETLRKYIPFEIGVHTALSILLLFHEEYYLFLLNLPLLIYNIRSFIHKDFKYYAFTNLDYHRITKNERNIKLKLGYYVVLVIITLSYFLDSFSKMMIYRIFGR